MSTGASDRLAAWGAERGLGLDAGELMMICLDRVYEDRADQVEWRLAGLSGEELETAEKNVEKLLEIIREVKNK